MAKKKEKDPRLALVKLYKDYLLTHGELPASLKAFMDFGSLKLDGFKKHFNSLEELEVALLLLYFKKSDDVLKSSSDAEELTSKERHLAFLYILVETVGEDEIFLREFLHQKRKQPSFIQKFMMALNAQELTGMHSEGKLSEVFEKVKINPKKTALTNHALAVIYFLLKDNSEDKQDTDAFIEKTTDLLFRLTDTSTLMSMFDLGKFMASRKQSVFTWE